MIFPPDFRESETVLIFFGQEWKEESKSNQITLSFIVEVIIISILVDLSSIITCWYIHGNVLESLGIYWVSKNIVSMKSSNLVFVNCFFFLDKILFILNVTNAQPKLIFVFNLLFLSPLSLFIS